MMAVWIMVADQDAVATQSFVVMSLEQNLQSVIDTNSQFIDPELIQRDSIKGFSDLLECL